MTNCEKAIEILQRTNDGHALYQSVENIERYGRNGDGWQLAIVQLAVNGNLNLNGQVLFDALYREILEDDYRYPLKEFALRFCPQTGYGDRA